jgi:hypothetical protein
MGKQRINPRSLRAELRQMLIRPDTKIVTRKLKICGHSEWEEIVTPDGSVRICNIKIYLDPRRDGHVRLVIHELLHMYFRLGKTMVYDMEEAAILAWEKLIYDELHLPRNERLLESWSQSIKRKMR